MCGICGSIGINNGKRVVQRMNAALIHRGPDGEGYLDKKSVHFGMRRLAIIDLNTGDQPIYNEDGSIAVVLNGEIYNYRELRRQLEYLGHQFRTKTDTEVIVHAYEEWGIACLKQIRGMFAFALYDENHPEEGAGAQRVYLVRDRLGIKPLYIWRQGSNLLFSSEVRSLLSSTIIPRQVELAGVYSYLAYGSVQDPLTLVEGVQSLTPGSYLKVDIRSDELETFQQTYWHPKRISWAEQREEDVRDWLLDAVGSHLISDVPLGAFLSGGVDSGTIAVLASQSLSDPIKTFTMGFENWPADERELAEITARHCKTDHQVRVVSSKDIVSDLPLALKSMDQPTMDGINSWYVSREAKAAGLTVALSGVGGDEIFAGYSSFRYVPILRRLPNRLSWLSTASSFLPPLNRWLTGTDFRRKVLAYLTGDLPINHPYFAVRGIFPESYLERILKEDAWSYLISESDNLKGWKRNVEEQIRYAESLDSIGEVSWLELSQYMRSTLLRDTDMMSMAHSLEVRVPFVDHLLVEKVLQLPGRIKIKQGVPKALLKKSLGSELPRKITNKNKRTFTFPFEIWLRGELQEQIKQDLLTNNNPDWLNSKGVKATWDAFERGETNWARPWSLYVLQKWIMNYL